MSRIIGDSLGRCYLLSRTIRDEYVFNSIMSNRLSDGYPGRGVLNTPHIDSKSTHSPFAGRLVGRMQYAPTLPAEKSDLNGWWEVTFGTRGDKSVFHSSMSNRLSDRYPCRGVLHTPHIDSTSTLSPLAGRLVGRMQYAPTLSEKDKVSSGRYFPLSRTMADKYVFHFFMPNRLSDGCPGRAQKHTPLARLSSTTTPFAGRLVGRMQYAPTLPEKDEVSLGRYFPLSRTRGNKSVFLFSMSNRLSNKYLSRAQKHTPLARLSSTLSPLTERLVGRMQYAPTLPEKDKVSLGRCFPLSWTMADKYVFHFFMSNRLSDRYPGSGVLNTPHNHSRKGYLIARQTIWGRMQYAPTLPAEKSNLKGWRGAMFEARGDEYVFHFFMSNRLSDRHPCRGVLHTLLNHSRKRYSIARQTIVGRMQYAPTLSEKDKVSLGRYFLLSLTMADKYVFHFIMSNRLSDRYPGRS